MAISAPPWTPCPCAAGGNTPSCCLLRDDFAACLAVVNGMELGVFIRPRPWLFAFYGQRAPRLEVRPLRLDGSVRLAEAIPSVLPHQNTALLLSAVTFPDTPPGIYRTNLEMEGEAGVTYLPVAVEVAASRRRRWKPGQGPR